jgi:hypothetical protein
MFGEDAKNQNFYAEKAAETEKKNWKRIGDEEWKKKEFLKSNFSFT